MHRSTGWRREEAITVFPVDVQLWVLGQVAEGRRLDDVMDELGLTPEFAYGRTRWDVEWRDALYRAQMAGRGCECPECRAVASVDTGARSWIEGEQ